MRTTTHRFTLFLATALFGCVSVASAQVTTDDIRAQARERVSGSLAEQEQQAYARSLLVRFETRVRQTESLITEVERRDAAYRDRMDALLTNDDGKRLGRKGDPSIRSEFLSYLEQPLIEPSELAAKKAFVEQMLGFLEQAKSTPGGYVPQPERIDEADDAYLWARARAMKLSEVEAWLNGQLASLDRTSDVTSAPTLKARIDAYLAEARQAWRLAEARGREAARDAAVPIAEENARIAELERALQEAELKLALARQEAEQRRIDFEMRMRQQEIELRERLAASQREMDERLAAIERDNQIAEAERRRRDAQAEAEARRIGDDAERIALVAKCNSPEVQADLAPFLATGTWQPGDPRPNMRIDSTPMSLSKLRAFGALDEDVDGIKNMLNVANNLGCTPKANGPNGLRGNAHIDTSRPKWGYPRSFHNLSADDIAEVRRIQALLIELGPTLVDEGMLAK